MLFVSSVFLFLSLQERLVGKTRNGEDQMKTLGQIFVSMVQRSITLMSWFQMHLNLLGGRAHILMQSSLIVSLFLYKSRSRIRFLKSFTFKVQNLSVQQKKPTCISVPLTPDFFTQLEGKNYECRAGHQFSSVVLIF